MQRCEEAGGVSSGQLGFGQKKTQIYISESESSPYPKGTIYYEGKSKSLTPTFFSQNTRTSSRSLGSVFILFQMSLSTQNEHETVKIKCTLKYKMSTPKCQQLKGNTDILCLFKYNGVHIFIRSWSHLFRRSRAAITLR